MMCLDTYALIEIARGSPAYSAFFNEDILLADVTLAEFYWVLLRDFGEQAAEHWIKKFIPYSQETTQEVLLKAMKYRFDHKKENLSFFDCAGYLFALENGYDFVTGDKEFKDKKNVVFVK